MSKAFFAAIKEVFGDQVHVIDRFHVVQQAVEALDAVLGAVKKQLDKDEAKELKKLRKRWLKSADQLNVDELSRVTSGADAFRSCVKRWTGCRTCASGSSANMRNPLERRC